MNIVLVSNTFTPHVGGVARSVEAFAEAYRESGHRVLVVAPEYADMPPDEVDVVRIPAIQNFNASDFSVALPVHPGLGAALDAFRPEIVHAQHPFLLGMTALRIARYRELPLVFTHHTLYESYTHYVPGDSPMLKRFIIDLATRYANLSDQVFAPSESIRDLLLERGVTAPLQVVPTGVRPELFAHGDGRAFRLRHGVPEQAVVIGHLGRLAPEKNLAFLTEAVAGVMQGDARVHFLVVGRGPAETSIRGILASAGVAERLHTAGILQHPELADALHAMDLFAFTSTSETQGMVLSEAMAAGLPVAALDAPGAREVVRDRENGRLVTEPTHAAFRAALEWLLGRSPAQRQHLSTAARATAERFSMVHCAATALACYASLRPQPSLRPRDDEIDWHRVRELIKAEWEILKSVALAGDEALGGGRE